MGNHHKTLEAPSILILDDEAMVRELLHDMLDLLGCRATVCASPLQALEILESKSFDLILSDFRMPHLTGQEFYDEAVGRDPELASRIIFLTGDACDFETQFFLRTTGSLHLAKPFQFASLKLIIEQALKRKTGAPMKA
jgi:CheY-like chemotaxis protein